MSEAKKYYSRTGHLTCSPPEVFEFVTDMRNFKRFIPAKSFEDLIISKESCSFKAAPIGNINIDLVEKNPFSRIKFKGTLLQAQDFSLVLGIREGINEKAEVILTAEARMNPFLKMMAEKYIEKFLEIIVDEMEKFRDWKGL
jgi:carbon monoxide dehydrogenase subunit G